MQSFHVYGWLSYHWVQAVQVRQEVISRRTIARQSWIAGHAATKLPKEVRRATVKFNSCTHLRDAQAASFEFAEKVMFRSLPTHDLLGCC